MRNYFLLLCMGLTGFVAKAQTGINTNTSWEFIKGDSSVPQITPVYGTQGIASQGNTPGPRRGSVTWTDAAGKLWLFGGEKIGGPLNYYNDLWKYDPATNQWTFVKGDNMPNVMGVYGIRGIPDNNNKPGAREAATSWIDDAGNFCLFGGYGYFSSEGYYYFETGELNDIWKYNPVTNQWTWVKGDNSIRTYGVYGTQGISGEANNPGGRSGSVSWKDASGNIWLFGGIGYIPNGGSGNHLFNDLWKYDPTTNNWTWMKGDGLGDRFPVFGLQGTPAPNNTPGSKSGSATWVDNSGNLWLFGGGEAHGFPNTVYGASNDLWKYNTNTNQWAWMKGDTILNAGGFYGTQGVATAANKPGARGGGSTWKDISGNLWLLSSGFIDLWKYNTGTNQWTWIKGDSIANVTTSTYGSLGIAAAANTPGSRSSWAGWKDNSDNFWLFGGQGIQFFEYLNDLWKYDPSINQWAWMKGDSTSNALYIPAVYGTQGSVSEGNNPGARESSVSWKDGSGNLWLFGGDADTASGINGYKNDLWKYNPSSKQWIWMKGDSTKDNTGVYGAITVAAAANKPGARFGSVSWTDASGTLWLFGGFGYHATAQGYLNDLWKYDPATNNWTWMKGDNSGQVSGVYGTIQVAAAANKPGARYGAMSWIDGAGYLWLFGGYGYDAFGTQGFLNDLWRYNTTLNQWTWMKGDNTVNITGVYGAPTIAATANKPGGRYYSNTWADGAGNLWLFAGYGYHSSSADFLNDLWRYNIASNEWTWMKGDNTGGSGGVYGTLGTESSGNKPGARFTNISWKDGSGNLCLFGGYGYGEYSGGNLNDLWKYNPVSNQWAWMKGDKEANQLGVFGTKGNGAMANTPGATTGSVSCTDASGNLLLFGGYGNTANGVSLLNLFWKYDTPNNQWTWITGEVSASYQGVFGVKGTVSPANKAGARFRAVSWADTTNNLWLFGGRDNSDYLNDLWKYDPVAKQWAWMKGDSTKNVFAGVYGALNTPAVANKPGAREGSVSWTDSLGKLWLFGGIYNQSGTSNWLNDLWKYDPVINQWAWIKGDNTTNALGVYGTPLIPAAANKPGAREGSLSWRDRSGNLWLFGGFGYTTSIYTGNLNDLWKYNPATGYWTFMKGNSTLNVLTVYGTMGIEAAANKPGGRNGSISWIDSSGKLWLFGGSGFNSTGSYGKLNDLWKYDPVTNNWTWMKGDNILSVAGVYGTRGVSSANNKPGARDGSVAWRDVYNNLWLLGGFGYGKVAGSTGNLNDLWRYSPSTNEWTWVKGDTIINTPGNSIKPGARTKSLSWVDGFGDLWLFGGYGRGTSGTGYLNDLWKIFGGTKYVFVGDGDWSNPNNWSDFIVAPTTITAGMNVIIDHNIPGVCINHGTIVLQRLGRLKVESQKLLTIDQGGLSNSGSVVGVGNKPGKVLFTGTNVDSLRSSGSITTPLVLSSKKMYLTGNTTTSSINLLGDAGVSSIALGNSNLNMDTASLIASSTNFIITEGTGKLVRHAVGNEPVIFHVGADANSYTPVTITTTTGTPDSFSVRVITGVTSAGATPGPVTSGNVNRTWLIEKATAGASTATITFQWNLNEEQSGFNRIASYISHKLVCPPPDPPSCYSSYYDAFPVSSAAGTNPYTQTRTGVTNFNNSPSFIVTSRDVVYTFINVNSIGPGDGNWSNPQNWANFQVPPNTITAGMDIVIDPTIGNECIFIGTLIVQPGGKLTVKPGKKLTLRPF